MMNSRAFLHLVLHRDDRLLNVLHFVLRSTPLRSAQQIILCAGHPSFHHVTSSPSPLTPIHMYKKSPRSHMPEIPCARALRRRLPYTQHLSQVPRGRRAVGCGPGPQSPTRGKRGKAQNTQGTQTQSTTLPGQCTYYTGNSALSAARQRGGSSAPLPTVFFFLVCFSASVSCFCCFLGAH